MAQCFLRRLGSYFNAALIVQANPDVMITVTGENVFVEKADGVTGIATFYLKKKGTYTIETNSTAELEAAGNTSTIDITKSGKINAQMLKIDSMLNASAYFYANDKLAICWENAATNYSGVMLRFSTEGFPTIDSGTLLAETSGMPIQSAGSVLNGFIHAGVKEGTTYYYSLFPYYDINGKRIYASKAKTINKLFTSAPQIVKITQSGTYTVPDGVRTLKLCAVGGGGGGGSSAYMVVKDRPSYPNFTAGNAGGAGGGGGIVVEKTIYVLPGDIIEVKIGKGGQKGNGGNLTYQQSSNTAYYSGKDGSNGDRTEATVKRGDTVIDTVIANGGTGGKGGIYRNGSDLLYKPAEGGNGNTKGGNGAYQNSTSFAALTNPQAGQDGTEKNGKKYGSSGGGGGISNTTQFGGTSDLSGYYHGRKGAPGGSNAGNGGGTANSPTGSSMKVTSTEYGQSSGTDGFENTGSGGGGGSGNETLGAGGNGGSGIVIAEYI